MKSDLDDLMTRNNIEALLITGPAQNNPTMYYMTGGGHLTNADLIKKRGEEPVLYFNPMERDEATRTGLKTRALSDYPMKPLMKKANGDMLVAAAMRYRDMLADLGIKKGKVAVYGLVDAGAAYGLFTHLQRLVPDLEIVGEAGSLEIHGASGTSLILEAMETKDEVEVEHIRKMGKITVEVVDQTAKFLQSHKSQNGELVKADGQPLTIANVKAKIDLFIAERGARNPHGVIFAIGQDAGVPHSVGKDEDHIKLGETIVFDIFIQEPGGGYHYDFTRTWCLGHASEEAQAVYNDVREVFEEIMGGLEAHTPLAELQTRTCELFEERGHATIESDPDTQEGYVHGLSHGLGLNMHEKPSARDPEGLLKPGVVVTIEPGLYYPERGIGCRLEDTIYVHPDGEIEVLAEYPLDLVLPLDE
ncbi:MAG: Xaa-Pro peptidase family protein [Chloroflexota bacterium]